MNFCAIVAQLKLFVIFALLFLVTCDFKDPKANTLLNFSKPILLDHLNNYHVTIIDSNYSFRIEEGWIAKDITDDIDWFIEDSEFRITLKPKDEIRAAKYYVTLESNKQIELSGFDSLNIVFFTDLLNLNEYYDNEIILRSSLQQVEYKISDDDYQLLDSQSNLLLINLPIRFKLFIVLTSNITGGPYNEAEYTVHFKVNGFYF